MKELYSLKKDRRFRKAVLNSRKYTDNEMFDTEFGIVGSNRWWQAVQNAEIEIFEILGHVSNLRITGHNDYPLFDLESDQGTTTWTPMGKEKYYEDGARIRIEYVQLGQFRQILNAWLLPDT